MSTDFKIRTPEKNFSKAVNNSTDRTIEDVQEDKELTTAFRDLHLSALSKAINISPNVTSVTLGLGSEKTTNGETNKDAKPNIESNQFIVRSSTPEKSNTGYMGNIRDLIKVNEKLEKLSPIAVEKKIVIDNNFSHQKLLNEFDSQRKLTVDKVMRERIQNMYDTNKLIRDSLEHLKQTRQEEAIARRLLLERKILDDIHEQEILNKPKREAEWAKDNLKEAQRIQERNQRVKDAEEEARKKSEGILLKRKQIDQILHLQKEYTQEHKAMLEAIKSCQDKAALTDFNASQSKVIKACTGLCEKLKKKCKQGDVTEEDVENAKQLVANIKLVHEGFVKEINRIHEEINAKKEESLKKSEEVKPQEESSSNSAPVSTTSTTAPSSERKIYRKMIESNQNRSFMQTTGHQNYDLETNFGPMISLKRKSQRTLSQPVKKKSQRIIQNPEEDIKIDQPKNKRKNKLESISNGFIKPQRKNLVHSSDAFDKGDVHKLKNKNLNVFRKKLKKVRFSDSTEIIECNFSSPLYFPLSKSDPSKNKDVIKSCIAAREAPFKNLSDCFDPKSLETYVNLKNVLENCEKTIEPLLADDTSKKFRFNCQKAVNIPVNAISPVSGPHLSDKYLKLHNLLSGRTVEVGDIKITATQNPLGILYCKYLLAKKFVRQGDLTVSSKPDAAFSIAAVLASLWVDFPDFGQLVLAHFQSACPYLAPVFMPQVEGQSDEEYHRSLGYHYSQNGEVEKQDSFLKRMSGIMRLYAALLISNVRQPGKMNPLGLSEGWRWISALLNLEPRPDICATLLYDFLEVAGNEMFRAYGGQFKKMLAYICQEYFPKLEKVTPSSAGGPMVRLEGFLQKILKEESIPPPQGVLPPNFW